MVILSVFRYTAPALMFSGPGLQFEQLFVWNLLFIIPWKTSYVCTRAVDWCMVEGLDLAVSFLVC